MGFPKQQQEHQPGHRDLMDPEPRTTRYNPAEKLKDKIALITGGDSGIGRATAIAFAKEGARVAIAYLDEKDDAEDTCRELEKLGAECVALQADISHENECRDLVRRTVNHFGGLNILVNNAAVQYEVNDLTEISTEQLEHTFKVNIFSMFWITGEALQHLVEGDCIINTTSINAYRGHPTLMDYTVTKSAIVGFTRSLSINLKDRGIRVNGVAPGPIWTPLIPASFDEEKMEKFGESVPMGRAGQPDEVAPCYVFLASEDSSYMSGQVLHPNGGVVING